MPKKVETGIQEYSQTEAALAELRERIGKSQYDVSVPASMELARKDRRELVSLRTGLEAKRKEIKAPALEHCRLIDAEAARITTELRKLEEREEAELAGKLMKEQIERQAEGYDIILRFCGSVGWLGILDRHNGGELYRTGNHLRSASLALKAVEKHLAAPLN